MFVTVKLNSSDVPNGTLVCHDSDNIWRQATSTDTAPLGVVTSTEVDDQGAAWGCITLAGATWARASEAIPDHGGWLACDDAGRVCVSPTEDCGLIAPLTQGATAPNVDDLILIYLR